MMTTTSTPVAISGSSKDVRIDADALDFAQQHNLVEYLNIAIQLAIRHFAPIEPVWVEFMIDPEADWDKLVLNVVVVGTVECVTEHYNAYVDDFIDAIPPNPRHYISLTTDIRSPK